MSKFTDQLGEIGIHNTYDIAGDGKPFITLHIPMGYRDVTPRAVLLNVKGRAFKDSAWYWCGAKAFCYGLTDRNAEVQRAISCAEKMFPGEKMVKGPWRFTWVCESDLNECKRVIRERDGKKGR